MHSYFFRKWELMAGQRLINERVLFLLLFGQGYAIKVIHANG